MECPKCGSAELGTGKQAGYAKVTSGSFGFGSNIKHTICTSCGFVVESYVEKPERFRS